MSMSYRVTPIFTDLINIAGFHYKTRNDRLNLYFVVSDDTKTEKIICMPEEYPQLVRAFDNFVC